MSYSLTIMDRYLAREIIRAWIAVFVVLMAVVLSAELVHFLGWLAEGRIPGDALLSFLGNSAFKFSVTLIPLSLFLGVVLSFARLYKDSEMTAMMSSGMGVAEWYRPLFLVVIPAGFALLFLMLFVMPQISAHKDIIKEDIKNRSEVSGLIEGQFNKSRDGQTVVFLEAKDSDTNTAKNVFLRQYKDEQDTVNIAREAVEEIDDQGRKYSVMKVGHQYTGRASDDGFTIIEYQEYGVYLPENVSTKAKDSIKSASTLALWNSDSDRERAELQWRISVPIAAVIAALLAMPLSRTTPRGGRFAKLAIALLVYLVYSNLLVVARTWITQGEIPVWLGIWWVHVLALMMLYVLLRTTFGFDLFARKPPTKNLIE